MHTQSSQNTACKVSKMNDVPLTYGYEVDNADGGAARAPVSAT